MTRRASLVLAAAAGALATALVGGIATAAIPGDGGVINGCYGKVGGVLRVIDTAKGQKCLPNAEAPVNWNQQGQAGLPGQAGATGQKGDKGDKGDPGVDGQPGQAGAPGERGAQGERGEKGEAGVPGGVSGWEIVRAFTSVTPDPTGAEQFFSLLATCPPGKKVVGGGGGSVNGEAIIVDRSEPFALGESSAGWVIWGHVSQTAPLAGYLVQASAICVSS